MNNAFTLSAVLKLATVYPNPIFQSAFWLAINTDRFDCADQRRKS